MGITPYGSHLSTASILFSTRWIDEKICSEKNGKTKQRIKTSPYENPPASLPAKTLMPFLAPFSPPLTTSS